MSENRTAASHWERVYQTRSAADVSWYQPSADLSLELIGRAEIECAAPIVDIGAGASTLVDGLLDRGHTDVSLLDVAPTAFAATRARLGARAEQAQYIVADITDWEPSRTYALWHDRAVFHFLTYES
jgi:trans-aconitate methyltransferase